MDITIIIFTSSKKLLCFFPLSRILPRPHSPSVPSHYHLHLFQSRPFFKDLLDCHPLGDTSAPSSFRGCLPFLTPPAGWTRCGALTQIILTVWSVSLQSNAHEQWVILRSHTGHKFQPALLALNSYFCSYFPVFLSLFPVTSYSTRPPPPPHCRRPERQRSSPSSPSRALHEVQSSLSTQVLGPEDGGKLGDNRIEVKLQRSPS